MNILKIWDADYPWDIRVEKILKSLSINGFNVSLVCRNLKRYKTFEKIENVSCFRLPFLRNKGMNYIFSFPFFFNPLWLYMIYKVAKRDRIHVLLVRDLPLSLTAIAVGKILRIPVVFDMAENYPAMLQDSRRYGKYRWSDRFVRNSKIAKIIENISLKQINQLIVVSEENKKRVEGKILKQKVSIISNTPMLSFLNIDNTTNEYMNRVELEFFQEKFTLIYIGGLGPIRGLDFVIESIAHLKQKIKDIHFLIIGDGEKRELLENLITDQKLKENITLKGWVDHNKIIGYLKISKVGIISHLSTEHTNTTIPNKLFDYMAFGIPVVSTDLAPIKRIINEANCGYTYKHGNKSEFIKIIEKLVDSDNKKIGENGIEAIRKKYNWSMDSKKLKTILKDICNSPEKKN